MSTTHDFYRRFQYDPSCLQGCSQLGAKKNLNWFLGCWLLWGTRLLEDFNMILVGCKVVVNLLLWKLSSLQGCSQIAVMRSQVVVMVFTENFNMIQVGCKVVACQLLRKLSWLLGCCQVAVTGCQVVAMVFTVGFNMISGGWLQGCSQVGVMMFQVVAMVLLAGCYDNPVSFQGVVRFSMYYVMIELYVF